MSDSKVPSSKQQLQLFLDGGENKREKKSVVERQPQPQREAVESITGTIQKRKNTFKAIKPNSLKNSSEIDGNKNEDL